MKSDNKFVALTSDRRFWEKGKSVSLLGTWCLMSEDDYDAQPMIEDYAIECNKDGFTQFKRAVDDLYQRYLSALSIFLNIRHKVNHSERYWEIIIGPFLYKYLGIMYERYLTISSLISKNSNFHTIVLGEESYCKKGYFDTDSFLKRTQNDIHNLEIYSKLLVFLGKNFPNKNVARDEIVLANKRGNFSRLLLEYLLNFVSFFKHDKEVVFFQNSYLSLGKLFYFSLVSRYRVKVKFSEHKYHKKRGVLSTLQRQELTDYLPDNGDFENFLKLWLPFDLPMCYVENYDYICRLSRMVYPKTAPNIIYSANAWYYDEVFKVWAAEHSAESILVGVQHGGNYGVVRHLFEEEFERRITDYYCTWGWEGKKSDSVISICSGKMWDYKEVKKIKSDEILFSMTIKPKFFSDIRRIPEESEGYLRSHKAFLDVVSLEVVSSIRIRPYQSLESFRIENLWKKYNNSILVEGWNVRFVDSLANCKLFICDHIMTTYLEALKMNVPTLVYFDVNYPSGMLREEAMKDFQKLERVGIVHSSIEELARAVNIIYKDIDTWWCNSELQTVRKEFCNKYANTSNCSVKNLDDMFAKMSKTY